ncbi:MAG: hypothetical protein OQK45_02215 [Sulfurovum sp.]|nr:hypothetical protein [Sulfurovum sp.]
MKKQKVSYILVASLLALTGLTQKANALPMFTQQTGMDCTGCHMQHMPRLNKFGRKFAASGMTMSQHIEDLNKTSDMDINPSLLIKSKFTRTWDKPDGKGDIKEDDTNDGDFSPVRMATFYMGGRVNENIGAILDLSWRKVEGGSITGKAVYAQVIEDGYWGTTFYSNSNQGPFSGMEFYNTGLYKPLRTFDMWNYTNANQSTRIGTKSATGLQVYYDKDNFLNDGDHFFVTAGIYTSVQDNTNLKMSENILPFARVAYEHLMGDYNVIIGAFGISGGKNVLDSEALRVKTEMYGMDLQIEGDIAEREASLTFTKIFKNKVEFTGIGAQLSEDTEDIYNDAFSVEGAVSVTPSIVGKVAYMTFDDRFDYKFNDKPIDHIDVKDLDYAINVGVDYAFSVTDMPMKLAVEYAWMNPALDRVKAYQSFMATLTLPF